MPEVRSPAEVEVDVRATAFASVCVVRLSLLGLLSLVMTALGVKGGRCMLVLAAYGFWSRVALGPSIVLSIDGILMEY